MVFEETRVPPTLFSGEAHVWKANLDESLSLDDRSLLSDAELARGDRLRNPVHSLRFVARHALVRRLLSAYIGIEPNEIAFAESPTGKPALAGDAWTAGWRFNVSDSEGRCLVAIARGVEVGIDVQAIRPIDDLSALAREVLADDELGDLLALPDDRRPEAFFRLWVQKEAIVKATGEGLARPLRTVRAGTGEGGKWMLAWSEIEDGFASALVTRELPVRVRLLRLR